MKSFKGLVAAVAMTLFGTAASAQTIRVNYIPILDVTPLFVGIDKGFFKEEGLTITPTPSTGGSAGIPGLMAGAFDIMYGNVVSTVTAQQQGFKLEVIAPGTKFYDDPDETSGIVIRAGDKLASGKDFEGKTVAVNTRNNVIWLFARAWIAKTGGDPAKVTFKEVPFPQMPDALRGKQVDAAFMVSPFMSSSVADKTTFTYVASPYREVQLGVEVGHWIAQQDYIKKNPELIAKYTRAFRKSVAWYNANRNSPDVVRVVSEFTKMKPELVAALKMQQLPEIVDPATVEKTVALMKSNALISADVDVRAMTYPGALK